MPWAKNHIKTYVGTKYLFDRITCLSQTNIDTFVLFFNETCPSAVNWMGADVDVEAVLKLVFLQDLLRID